MPEDFSDQAKDFVRGCLNKIPKLRPTYALLLRHPWLTPLLKPPTISEEDEEAAEEAAENESTGPPVLDKEVADWVKDAIDKRRRGVLGKAPKPALHAAPLDAVSSPSQDGAPNGLDAAGAVEVPTT